MVTPFTAPSSYNPSYEASNEGDSDLSQALAASRVYAEFEGLSRNYQLPEEMSTYPTAYATPIPQYDAHDGPIFSTNEQAKAFYEPHTGPIFNTTEEAEGSQGSFSLTSVIAALALTMLICKIAKPS